MHLPSNRKNRSSGGCADAYIPYTCKMRYIS
jgi:hypothetical protein